MYFVYSDAIHTYPAVRFLQFMKLAFMYFRIAKRAFNYAYNSYLKYMFINKYRYKCEYKYE